MPWSRRRRSTTRAWPTTRSPRACSAAPGDRRPRPGDLDRDTGRLRTVAPATFPVAYSIHPSTGFIVEIDPTTGQGAALSRLDLAPNQIDAITVDDGGELLISTGAELFRADLQTGAADRLAIFDSPIAGLAQAPASGALVAAIDSSLVEIDTCTGAVSPLFDVLDVVPDRLVMAHDPDDAIDCTMSVVLLDLQIHGPDCLATTPTTTLDIAPTFEFPYLGPECSL